MNENEIYEQDNRPAAVHAEKTTLGAMMVDEVSLERGVEGLEEDDFSLDSHRRIFRSMVSLLGQGEGVDITTVANDLRKHRELDAVGSVAYLASLSEGLPRRLSIESYIRILKEKSALRQILTVAAVAQSAATDQSEESTEIAARILDTVNSIIEGRTDSTMERMGEFLNRFYPESESIFDVSKKDTGIPSGWEQYDALTMGFHRGELTVVAARPSMGKTAWVGSLLDGVARAQGRKTAVFALEQAKRSLMSRMLCGRAQASLKRFNSGTSTQIEKQYIVQALDEYRTAPLFWDDKSLMTVTAIRNKLQRMVRDGQMRRIGNVLVPELDLAVIDQLSHVGMSDIDRKLQRDEKKGEVALRLKKLAKDLNIPVVLMCQLNRATLKNKDQVPTLADLAESGYLEQHADNVVFLHRPEYYDKEDETLKGKGQMIIAKQRDGPTGTCNVLFQADLCRWEDKSKPPEAKSFTSLSDWTLPNGY